MTTLLLDVGNTRVKWGFIRSGLYEFSGSMALSGVSVEQFLQLIAPESNKPDHVIMSAVGDSDWLKMLRFSLAHVWSVKLLEVVAETDRNGMRNGYAQPNRLGVDRWCALLGAWQMKHEAVCVVDAGTALTIDVINNGGEHLGGLIVPGLAMMRGFLAEGTANLAGALAFDGVSAPVPVGVLGRNTEQCVAGGALWTLAASVERLRLQSEELVGGTMHCIITGGDAQQLLPLLSGDWTWVPDLVLKGLLAYADTAQLSA